MNFRCQQSGTNPRLGRNSEKPQVSTGRGEGWSGFTVDMTGARSGEPHPDPLDHVRAGRLHLSHVFSTLAAQQNIIF